MTGNLDKAEMADLLQVPAFRRFLWRLTMEAGIFTPTTIGTDSRDLAFREGRRHLGLEILRWAEEAHPLPRNDASVSALLTILSEANTTPKEQPRNERTDRYRDE